MTKEQIRKHEGPMFIVDKDSGEIQYCTFKEFLPANHPYRRNHYYNTCLVGVGHLGITDSVKPSDLFASRRDAIEWIKFDSQRKMQLVKERMKRSAERDRAEINRLEFVIDSCNSAMKLC
jgi:hypothetical protein